MDPFSHTLVTRAVLRERRLSWRRLFALGNWPDIGYYLLYPVWLARTGKLRSLVNDEAPIPPRSLQVAYNLTHSLLIVGLLALMFRRRVDRSLFISWAAHIITDAPTHSRRIYPTRFLWPLSQFALNGWSWAEVLHAHGRRHVAVSRARRLVALQPPVEVLQPAGEPPAMEILQLPTSSPAIKVAEPVRVERITPHSS